MSLRDLEKKFQDALLYGDEAILSDIETPALEVAQERLSVYRQDYSIRLVDSIEEDFPCTRQMLGAELFQNHLQRYLREMPSQAVSIRSVSNDLLKYLISLSIDPSIIEMAKFEYALTSVLFKEDAEVLTLAALSDISPDDWPSLIFHLHPTVSLCMMQFNTLDVWKSMHAQSDSNDPLLDAKLLEKENVVMIWRDQHQAFYRNLTPVEFSLIKAVNAGQSFDQLCETVSTHLDETEVVPWLSKTLQTWIGDSIFSSRLELFPE